MHHFFHRASVEEWVGLLVSVLVTRLHFFSFTCGHMMFPCLGRSLHPDLFHG